MEVIPSSPLDQETEGDDNLPTNLHGPPAVVTALKVLILKYRGIFSQGVEKDPAKITPFKFTVDPEKWEIPANRTRRRQLNRTQSAALNQLIFEVNQSWSHCT